MLRFTPQQSLFINQYSSNTINKIKIRRKHLSTLCLTFLMIWSMVTLVFASGLEIPGGGTEATARGGADVSGITNPTAGFLNPGVLSRLKGLQLTYNHSLIWNHVSFERTPSSLPSSLTFNENISQNNKSFFPLGGLLAISHDFNTPITWGFSIYGPNGTGASDYNVQGSQRYMMTGIDGLIAYAGLSASYGGKNWGIGATLQYALMPQMKYRMVVDGTSATELNPYLSPFDVEAEIDVSDYSSYSAILGAWIRPIPTFEIALSGRVIPVYFNAKGTVSVANTPNEPQFTKDQIEIKDGKATLDLTLPPTARLGLRYRNLKGKGDDAIEHFDVELAVVYEAWHFIDSFKVNLEGSIPVFGDTPLSPVSIDKKWRDTFSVRLGSSWHVTQDLTLMAGSFWEQGAMPANYAHIDFPSFDRLGASTGLAYALNSKITLNLAYMHVFESSSRTTETDSKVFQQRPIYPCPDNCGANDQDQSYSGVPTNAGVIKTSFNQLSLGLTARF
jgi:long-subunit fatty acid transport protein